MLAKYGKSSNNIWINGNKYDDNIVVVEIAHNAAIEQFFGKTLYILTGISNMIQPEATVVFDSESLRKYGAGKSSCKKIFQ